MYWSDVVMANDLAKFMVQFDPYDVPDDMVDENDRTLPSVEFVFSVTSLAETEPGSLIETLQDMRTVSADAETNAQIDSYIRWLNTLKLDIQVTDLDIADDRETIIAHIDPVSCAEEWFCIDPNEMDSVEVFAMLNPWEDHLRGVNCKFVRHDRTAGEKPFYPTFYQAEQFQAAIVEAVRNEYHSRSDDKSALKGFVRKKWRENKYVY